MAKFGSKGFLATLAVVGIVVAGNFHFINGSTTGFRVLQKKSFSLSEVYVNMDELGNMPAFMARAKYPMTIAALAERMVAAGAEPDLSHEKISQVYVGMSKADLYAKLGIPATAPDSVRIGNVWRESVTYSSALQGRFVYIDLEDDRVVKVRE